LKKKWKDVSDPITKGKKKNNSSLHWIPSGSRSWQKLWGFVFYVGRPGGLRGKKGHERVEKRVGKIRAIGGLISKEDFLRKLQEKPGTPPKKTRNDQSQRKKKQRVGENRSRIFSKLTASHPERIRLCWGKKEEQGKQDLYEKKRLERGPRGKSGVGVRDGG